MHDMIHWIVSHTDLDMMTLSSVSGTKIATFRAQDYQHMHHMSKPVIKFRMTPNQIYKMKILQKVYQYLVIFACRFYSQESTKTFSQSWVIPLDQLASEGKACN